MDRVYNKSLFLEHYKSCKSFRLNPEMIDENAELVIGSIDLSLTTRCSLRCKHCGSLIDHYEHPSDVDIDVVIRSLNRLLSVVDLIVRVNVLGGEPFLYPHLDTVLEYLQSRKEIERVYIPTNGLYLQEKKSLLHALHGSKIRVRISRYSDYDNKSKAMIQTLEREGISYSVKEFGPNDFLWYDFGGFEKRNRSQSELEEQYRKCDVEWYSVFQGKIFPCPRAAHAADLNYITADDNCIDLLDYHVSAPELKKKLQNFIFDKKHHPCCNHCDRGTTYCPLIKVAEQVKPLK